MTILRYGRVHDGKEDRVWFKDEETPRGLRHVLFLDQEDASDAAVFAECFPAN